MTSAQTPTRYSYSTAIDFNGCPRRWQAKRKWAQNGTDGDAAGGAADADAVAGESDTTAGTNQTRKPTKELIGSLVHRICEHLLNEPSENRTQQRAEEITDELWDASPGRDLRDNSSAKQSAAELRRQTDAYVRDFVTLYEPHKRDVVATEKEVTATFGGRPFIGYPDLITRHPTKPDRLTLIEIKTGKPPPEEHGDRHKLQVALYAAALRKNGMKISRARLLYLSDGDRQTHPFHRIYINRFNLWWAARWFTEIVDKIKIAERKDRFPAKPSALCASCPNLHNCKEGQPKGYSILKQRRRR